MKTVQKQYKNSTKTVNYFLDVRRGLFEKLWIMTVPLLFLCFNFTSCSPTEPEAQPEKDDRKLSEIISTEEFRLLLSKSLNAEVKYLEVQNRTFVCEPGLAPGCFPTQTVTGYSINYNGCDIIVSYKTRTCFNGGGVLQVDVWDLEITSYDPLSCNTLLTHWANLQSMGQIHQLAKERNEMYTALVKEIELALLVPITQIIVIQCGTANSAYNVSFYENACTATCFLYKLEGGIEIYETNCGDMCCKRVSQFCINEKGELEPVGTPTTTSLSGNCTAPTSQCLYGLEGVCTNPCERIGADL
jgi:hypothetical protein